MGRTATADIKLLKSRKCPASAAVPFPELLRYATVMLDLCSPSAACSPIFVPEFIPYRFTPSSTALAAVGVVRVITAYASYAIWPIPTVFPAEAQEDTPITGPKRIS